MKPSTFIFKIIIIFVGIGILFYLANYGLSTQSVPSLQEYIASTEKETTETLVSTSSSSINSVSTSTYSVLRTPTSSFRIQTARNTETRTQGLSGRELLDPDEGLLFIFPQPGSYGFWMKDMNFSIDIVWINSSKKVVGITENISPETFPDMFSPPQKIQFVLEVNAGAARNSGLATGTVVSF